MCFKIINTLLNKITIFFVSLIIKCYNSLFKICIYKNSIPFVYDYKNIIVRHKKNLTKANTCSRLISHELLGIIVNPIKLLSLNVYNKYIEKLFYVNK